MSKKTPFRCSVVADVLRIEIGISTLKYAAEHHEDFWQPQTDKYALVVSDERQFAKDVAHELNREGEDGSTPVTRLFDVSERRPCRSTNTSTDPR
jgi:hypothetical protein